MKRLSFVFIIFILIQIACGKSSSVSEGEIQTAIARTQAAIPTEFVTAAPTAETTAKSTPASAPTEAVTQDALEKIRSATVQIEATGSFVDPELGNLYNAGGRGTGVIIDPSGIAVTNNHVVTGAATLKVWLEGETEPRNATVLGASECWDLAVIDIQGEDFPYLEFSDVEVSPGLEVYAAGFPLGDPEYTLTKGIVSKANANGETYWASVKGVLEHDSRIRSGNSGGPLVDMQGNIVGINYAANDQTDQNFAIRTKDAQSVIETLRSGKDFESIGINGQAVMSDDGTLSGIWVSSVKSGSPADKTGVKGGDMITRMEGLVLATDGTMADYCDVLRTRKPEDTLSIEVLRFADQEYLTGQLNGRTLETSFSFANELGSESGTETGAAGNGENVLVQDDEGAIEVSIPASWSQVDGSNWVSDDEVIGSSITAAADVDRFLNTYEEPGVFFGVSDQLAKLGGYIQVLDVYRDNFRSDCKNKGRFDYEDSAFEGAYDVYENCSGSRNTMVVLSARPIVNKTSLLVTIMFNSMTDSDLDVLDEILRTFDVVGSLP